MVQCPHVASVVLEGVTPPVAPRGMLLLALLTVGAEKKPLPQPPKQFSVRVETTAHQLNATSDYPPYKRYMTVHYDYAARRARIESA